MEDTPNIYKVEVLDTPEVAKLKIKIQNEINSYNLSPVIDDKVQRIAVIKDVPYKALLEYAKTTGALAKLEYGKYTMWLYPTDKLSISVDSDEVKTKTIIIEE